ncbi:MAG: hypothetical protein LBR37_01005 [Erysipelotrichaceae bacterium]|jgi:hypothetical protein|nr:hypothetical protein [Erysipelotrichaceae bacterium]
MRSITRITTNHDRGLLKRELGEFFVNHGYTLKDRDGENVWQKGNGWLTAPMFFRVDFHNDTLIIESWVKTALFPGFYVGESGLDSSYAFAIKPGMRNMLRHIIDTYSVPGFAVSGYVPGAKK